MTATGPLGDLGIQTSTVTGTADYDLTAATAPAQDFRDFLADGASGMFWAVANDDPTQVEAFWGTLTYGTPDVLSRDTIRFSSNSGNKVNWDTDTLVTIYSNAHAALFNHAMSGFLSASGTRPDEVQAGGQWIDGQTTTWVIYRFDGTNDVLEGWLDTTNNFFHSATRPRIGTTSTTYAVGADNINGLVAYFGTGGHTWTLPAAAGAGIDAGFFVTLVNLGTGSVTIDPDGSETIDGASTLTLVAGDTVSIFSDGASAWYTTQRLFTRRTVAETVTGNWEFDGTVAIDGVATFNALPVALGNHDNNGIANVSSRGGIEVKGNGTGAAAVVFHRPLSRIEMFGIDTDNKWKHGGGSAGANAYEFYTQANPPVFTLAAAQGLSGQTALDFTGIPSTTTVIFVIGSAGISWNGTDQGLVQIGDSGGIETSGYDSYGNSFATGVAGSTSTAGFLLRSNTAADTNDFVLCIVKADGSNRWNAFSLMQKGANGGIGHGTKQLSGTLDRVRFTRSGSNTGDGGQVAVLYF